jgi:hypothetical protein
MLVEGLAVILLLWKRMQQYSKTSFNPSFWTLDARAMSDMEMTLRMRSNF